MTGAQPKLKKGNASSTGYSPASPLQIQQLQAISKHFGGSLRTPVNNPSPYRNFSAAVASGKLRRYLDLFL
jgi:hypothetical protein